MGENLKVYNSLLMIKLVILSVVACFADFWGMVSAITVSIFFMLWVCAKLIGFGKGQAVAIIGFIGLFSYLAFGILLFKDFLVNNEPLTTSFYIWAILIFVPMVVINIVNYIKNPIRFYYFETRKYARKRKKERAKYVKAYNKYQPQLNTQFEKSIVNIKQYKGYITLSENAPELLQGYYPLATLLAHFTTLLIIKACEKNDFETARIYLDSYIDSIVPYAGLSGKSLDVASMGIALSILSSDDDIYLRIEKHIIGEGFDLSKIKNATLLFNLACRYSLEHDKESLLNASKYALQQGMSAEQFVKESDFDAYRNDEDFLAMVNEYLLQE